MLKTLPATSHHLTVCEANFIRLKKLLNNYLSDEVFFESINPNKSSLKINFLVLSKTKHTIILEAKRSAACRWVAERERGVLCQCVAECVTCLTVDCSGCTTRSNS